MTLLYPALFVVWTIAVTLSLYGTYLCVSHFRKKPAHLDAPFNLYPVSVLKPLKGADPSLKENLETFFRLDYPSFELLFSVAESDDPAVGIVRGLMRKYPSVNAQLIVAKVDVGLNPKVNNLATSYELARHDLILISDSNVRVDSATLKRLVAQLDNSVGMITAVVGGHEAGSFGGALEATYLNTFYARGMLLAAKFGRPCVVGKCMLFRRSMAQRFGGIRALGRYLAEDYMAGEAVRRLGLAVIYSCETVCQIIGNHTTKDFWSRHIRWGRIRKSQEPLAFFCEPWLGSIVSGILGAIAARALWGISMHTFIALHLMLWASCDIIVMRATRYKLGILTPFHWFAREISALPLWIHIASGNTVLWRGQRLTLQAGGILIRSRGQAVLGNAKE